jgi:hypothetical protein
MIKRMPKGTTHSALVSDLVALGAKSGGFAARVRELLDGDPMKVGVHPDAWLDAEMLVAIEVDDTHTTSTDKLTRYADLWLILDSESDRELGLLIVDRLGAWSEVSLQAAWYHYHLHGEADEVPMRQFVVRSGTVADGLPRWT